MAKKNFKGGLDSLIENSLGIRKSGKKGEMRGNPIDLLPEQTENEPDDKSNQKPQTSEKETVVTQPADGAENVVPQPANGEENVVSQPADGAEPVVTQPADGEENVVAQPVEEPKPVTPEPAKAETSAPQVEVQTKIKAPTIEVEATDSEKNTYLKNMIADLRKELFLWRNGKINVQSFNATLHSHGLKYNSENNEIEEF